MATLGYVFNDIAKKVMFKYSDHTRCYTFSKSCFEVYCSDIKHIRHFISCPGVYIVEHNDSVYVGHSANVYTSVRARLFHKGMMTDSTNKVHVLDLHNFNRIFVRSIKFIINNLKLYDSFSWKRTISSINEHLNAPGSFYDPYYIELFRSEIVDNTYLKDFKSKHNI